MAMCEGCRYSNCKSIPNIVNLTQRDVVILSRAGKVVYNLPANGELAYISKVERTLEFGQEFEIVRNSVPKGIPKPEEGKYFLVSGEVRQACFDRKDLLSVEDQIKSLDCANSEDMMCEHLVGTSYLQGN